MQVTWHHPVDLDHLTHFINVATNEIKTLCLHDKQLNITFRNHASLCNLGKTNLHFMLAAVEEQLQKRNNPHFLTKISHLLCHCREPRKVVLMFFNSVLELHNFAMSQSCKQFIEPFKFSSNQALQDLFIKLQL